MEKLKKKVKPHFAWVKNHRVFSVVALAAILLLAIAIVGTMLFYRDKAAPGTSIVGVNVSGQTESQLRQTLDDIEKKIQLNISFGDKVVKANASDLGITMNNDKMTEDALKTGRRNIFSLLFARQKFDLVAKYDNEKSHDFINQNFPELTADPVDAQVTFNGAQFVVQPGADGTAIDVKKFDAAIHDLIKQPGLSSFTLTTDGAPPTIDTAAAEKAATAANTRLGLDLSIINNGRAIWKIDPPEIAAWTTFTANAESNRYIIDYDKSKIIDFLNSTVADQIAGKPINRKAITDESGNVLRVVTEGRSGQAPNNVNQLAGQIVVALNDAVSDNFEMTTNDSPFKTDQTVAANGRWVEANLSNFSVMLYEGTNLVWQTSRTSNGKASTPSITGLFKVFQKTFNQCMPNPGPNGEPAPPLCNIHYVTYWGPGGYAFHEAWWLGPGNTNARISHGCINMYKEDAKTVYDFSSIGTPVWVHW